MAIGNQPDDKLLALGAQDRELKNSPVDRKADEGREALREWVPGAGVWYFNNEAYEQGRVLKSGDVLLRFGYGISFSGVSSDLNDR